jgi:predicted NAD/FAD-binding protein
MRIAVIGAGIAGLASAWLLSRAHEVTLYEANDYLGGHTHTHDIEFEGARYAIDTGFIVYNETHYPLLTRLFRELDVTSQSTSMSFSVQDAASGIEYNTAALPALFCQWRNLASPRFHGMLADILRFYREAPDLLAADADAEGPTLDAYLRENRYGETFRNLHLIPMASALWSASPNEILPFPMRYLIRFMANHQMLQVRARPTWRVVRGGSKTYVQALQRTWRVRERTGCAARMVWRDGAGVEVTSAAGRERYDHVVLACHGDEALSLLADADVREREVLGAIRYRDNEVVLHTDASLLPRRRRAWAAWNAYVPVRRDLPCTVSYCMNILQGIRSSTPFVVSLNRGHEIDPEKILRRMRYQHPQYDHAAVAAQRRKNEIQGIRRTWFAGAYWGFGFHEDGLRSAVEVASRLGVEFAADRPNEVSLSSCLEGCPA